MRLAVDLRRALLDRASLTRRVREACPGRFTVQVVQQRRRRPTHGEQRLLGMRRGTRALIREVRLCCDEHAWVFARTVIPMSSLVGAQRRLKYLGTRPLGAVLFADPSMRRGAVQLACARAGHVLFDTAVAGLTHRPAQIWGRRSVFHVGGKPLLVSEMFLPAMTVKPRAKSSAKDKLT